MTGLILAGTGEARALCKMCQDLPVIASLAGVTRKPKSLAVPTRHGPFGGDDGFERYLTEHGIKAVVDATHPFTTIGRRTARICAAHSIPYLRLLRVPWPVEPQWRLVPSFAEARKILPQTGVVFLATGAQSAVHFAGLTQPEMWLRRVDRSPGKPPWAQGGYSIGLPSNDPAEERALFERLRVTCLIAKNAGGPQGYAKLLAAREMGLQTIIIDRPPVPDVQTVEEIADASAWLHAQAL